MIYFEELIIYNKMNTYEIEGRANTLTTGQRKKFAILMQ